MSSIEAVKATVAQAEAHASDAQLGIDGAETTAGEAVAMLLSVIEKISEAAAILARTENKVKDMRDKLAASGGEAARASLLALEAAHGSQNELSRDMSNAYAAATETLGTSVARAEGAARYIGTTLIGFVSDLRTETETAIDTMLPGANGPVGEAQNAREQLMNGTLNAQNWTAQM